MKNIYDPVHGFIRCNDWESQLIDSLPFQRLHSLRQLGIAYLVYPGATHTRFEHSLGVMVLATEIFDRIVETSDLSFSEDEKNYWRQILRLAALCHDLGHLPFSHVAESVLLGQGGHEEWTLHIIKSTHLRQLWEKFQQKFPQRNVEEDIIKMSIGESSLSEFYPIPFSPLERVLCEVITGDFFGADRIDYLLRDARCTGVAYGLFDYHQLIEMLRILPINEEGWKMGVEENGIEACEALLLARYFMHKRVYQYPTVKAYSFHLSRFMKALYKDQFLNGDLDNYLSQTDSEVLAHVRQACSDKNSNLQSDAISLSVRKKRFKAFSLMSVFSEETLQEIKKNLDIPDERISWTLSTDKPKNYGLSLPVQKRNSTLIDASQCSSILIPSGSYGWVYVDPDYEKKFSEELEKASFSYTH